jgi:hypothetical protein
MPVNQFCEASPASPSVTQELALWVGCTFDLSAPAAAFLGLWLALCLMILGAAAVCWLIGRKQPGWKRHEFGSGPVRRRGFGFGQRGRNNLKPWA